MRWLITGADVVLGHACWDRAGLALIGDWQRSLRQALLALTDSASAGSRWEGAPR
jgi:hypothetical protein